MKHASIFAKKGAVEGKKVPDFLQDDTASDSQPITKPSVEGEVVKKAYKEGAKEAREQQQDDAAKLPVPKTYIDKRKEEQQAGKSQGKQESEAIQRVNAIIAHQELELFRTKSLFPFTFFPDTIIIDTNKITIVKKEFFANEFITTIPLKDLSDVTVRTAFLMGSVTIEYMPQASSPGAMQSVHCTITSLKRKDAIQIQNLLKGALIAKAEDIDIAKLPPEEVKSVITKFGSSDGLH